MSVSRFAHTTRLLPAAFALISLLLAGCSDQPGAGLSVTASGDGPYTVVATVGMVADTVRHIAGERANVIGLLGEGVDPHTHSPTRSDAKQLQEADVVFYSGLMLEGRMAEVFDRLQASGKNVFAVTEGLDHQTLIEPDGVGGHPDPHVWMDAALWSRCAKQVSAMLAKYDPAHADEYHARAEAYCQELSDLDAYVKQVIQSIPEQQRVLVTAHDAFAYFSRAYGIPVRSVQGISTASEAGVDDVNRLVDFLVENKVPAIFVESSVSSQHIQAVVEGAARRGAKLGLGGTLYSDAMGPHGTYEGTYLGMIDHNATTIARALGGTAPERGRLGKLVAPQNK